MKWTVAWREVLLRELPGKKLGVRTLIIFNDRGRQNLERMKSHKIGVNKRESVGSAVVSAAVWNVACK